MTTTTYNVSLSTSEYWGVPMGNREFEVVREETDKKGRAAVILLVNGIERSVLKGHTTLGMKSAPVVFAEPTGFVDMRQIARRQSYNR